MSIHPLCGNGLLNGWLHTNTHMHTHTLERETADQTKTPQDSKGKCLYMSVCMSVMLPLTQTWD